MKNIYVSLEKAREELEKRRNNVDLRKKIEVELKDKLLPELKDEPRAILLRQICPADNGFVFFLYCAQFLGLKPLICEYPEDIFVSFNEEKKGLGRLRIVLKNGKGAIVDIMNFYKNEKKKLKDIVIKTGDRLVDFHRNLFAVSKYKVDFRDNSSWHQSIGSASEYYYYLLLNFVAHGVLFERFIFSDEDKRESVFTDKIVLPAIRKIEEKFGVKPLIVRLYPENQNPEMNFYWWCYPPYVNDFIVDYAVKNNLVFRYLN